ncbi:MAG TPA: PIN domain-containing protein [Planctomycetaceae bacterium]|nr:PIN domain-containing protein [Planctomycetaceae bacterium]
MPAHVVFDSGPLVALFDRDDEFHRRSVDFIRRFRGTAVSNLAVVTEVMYLLDFSHQAQTDFLEWVRAGALELVELNSADFERIIELMAKYADRPMDFADASLVAICERLDVRDIASVDNDFLIYRFRKRSMFRNVFLRGT